jgi:integral membrane sensor domain MASE1
VLYALILVSGIMALKLAVPPGYASPIWPPAGIALAALMLWGRSMLPAIWLGSLTLNLWLGTATGNPPSPAEIAAAALIATGSTLQAVVASWLVGKNCAQPCPDWIHLTISFCSSGWAAY